MIAVAVTNGLRVDDIAESIFVHPALSRGPDRGRGVSRRGPGTPGAGPRRMPGRPGGHW